MEESYRVDNKLSESDKRILERLPSVRHRKLDIRRLLKNNKTFTLYDQREKLLFCTFYHVFDNFVYLHASIGRDEYKPIVARKLLPLITSYGTCISVFFNSPGSMKASTPYGAKKLIASEDNPLEILDKINLLTDSKFYIESGIIFDENDIEKIENPIYTLNRENYLNSIRKNLIKPKGLFNIIENYSQELKSNYEKWNGSIKDINKVYDQLIYPIMGKNIIPPELFKTFFKRNKNIITIGAKKSNQEFRYFYCILPLTENAFESLRNNEKNIWNLNDTDITEKGSPYAYAAGMGAFDRRSKASCVLSFVEEVLNYSKVISNPVTAEGLAFLKKANFSPIDNKDESKIGVMHIWDLEKQL